MAATDAKSRSFGSAEELARLIPAVRVRDWVALGVTALLFVLLAAWSMVGVVPTNVTGRGILIQPRQPLVQAQTLSGGRIVSIHVKVGDTVERGQLIGRVDQSDIRKRIDEDRAHVADLQKQESIKTAADQRFLQLQAQQDALEKRALEVQRATLQQSLKSAEELGPILEKRRDAVRELVRGKLMGAAAKDVPEAEAPVNENLLRMEDLKSRLGIIDGQIKQLETRAATQERNILELSIGRQNQIDEFRRPIKINELQLNRNGEILSDAAGRVVEVLVTTGMVLPPGGALISMETLDADQSLTSVSYLPIAEAKKVEPGMQVQVTPDLVERQRFGGILGSVVSVGSTAATREGAMRLI